MASFFNMKGTTSNDFQLGIKGPIIHRVQDTSQVQLEIPIAKIPKIFLGSTYDSTKYIDETSYCGNAATATKLSSAKTISLSGAATGTATGFDGSENIEIPVTSVNSDYLTWGSQKVPFENLPTGDTSVTVAVGNHTHDTRYLKLSGGNVTGTINLAATKTSESESAQLKFTNSNASTSYASITANTAGFMLFNGEFGADGTSSFRSKANSNATLGTSTYPWKAVYGTTLYENGTALTSKYLGVSATAADSSKLNNQDASYYLNYNNLNYKPNLGDAAGYGVITTKDLITSTATDGLTTGKAVYDYVADKISGVYLFKGTISTVTIGTAGQITPPSGTLEENGFVYNVSSAFTYKGKEYPAGTNIVCEKELVAGTTVVEWKPLGGVFNVDLDDYQEANADLSAIASLTSTGFLKRTGNAQWALVDEDYVKKSGDTMTGTLNIEASASNAATIKSLGNAVLNIGGVSTSTDYIEMYVNGGGNNNRPLVLQNGFGNVGIGLAAPAYKLHVSGSANATSIYENGTLLSNKYQAKDGDLTAISALTTTGFLQRTGSDTWALTDVVTKLGSRTGDISIETLQQDLGLGARAYDNTAYLPLTPSSTDKISGGSLRVNVSGSTYPVYIQKDGNDNNSTKQYFGTYTENSVEKPAAIYEYSNLTTGVLDSGIVWKISNKAANNGFLRFRFNDGTATLGIKATAAGTYKNFITEDWAGSSSLTTFSEGTFGTAATKDYETSNLNDNTDSAKLVDSAKVVTYVKEKFSSLAGVATSGSYSDLADVPANLSNFYNDIKDTSVTTAEDKLPTSKAVRDYASPIAGSSLIATVGTITSGTWQGTKIGKNYLDSNIVYLTDTQKINNKTYNGLYISVPGYSDSTSDSTKKTMTVETNVGFTNTGISINSNTLTYTKNTTLGDAAEKGVASEITNGGANLPTAGVVYDYALPKTTELVALSSALDDSTSGLLKKTANNTWILDTNSYASLSHSHGQINQSGQITNETAVTSGSALIVAYYKTATSGTDTNTIVKSNLKFDSSANGGVVLGKNGTFVDLLATGNPVKTAIDNAGSSGATHAGNTTNASKLYLIGTTLINDTNGSHHITNVSSNNCYVTDGDMHASSFQTNGDVNAHVYNIGTESSGTFTNSASMQYNTIDECIEFVFA